MDRIRKLQKKIKLGLKAITLNSSCLFLSKFL